MNQKGIAHLLLLILLVAGVGIGIQLVKNSAVFSPKATETTQFSKIGATLTNGSYGDCTSSHQLDNTNYIQFYNQPGMREKAKAQMAQMRSNGIETLRVLVWFHKDAKNFIDGTLSSKTGKVENWGPDDPDQPNQPHRDNFIAFVKDIKEAGFTRLTLSPGPGWKNTPRDDAKGEHGIYPNGAGVYDPSLMPQNWSFIQDMVTISKANGPSDFVLDIAMLEPIADLRIRQNSLDYVKTVYTNYINTFGHDGSSLTASAGFFNSEPEVVRTNLQYIIDSLKSTGKPLPNYYTVMLYMDRGQTLNALNAINTTLKQNNLPNAKIRLMELYYEDPQQAEAINEFLRANPGMIDEAIPWPVTRYSLTTRQCYGMDVDPPYTAMHFMKKLGMPVLPNQQTSSRGNIAAQPATCQLTAAQTCSSKIIWDTSDVYTNSANVTVKVRESGGELSPAIAQSRGEIMVNWISANGFHFDLYLNDSFYDSVFVKGSSTPRSDLITASPNPCILGANGLCSADIKLNALGYENLQIKVRESGVPFTGLGASPTGSWNAPWINASGYNFDLYSNAGLIGSVSVKGLASQASPSVSPSPIAPTGIITASPNPCQIQAGYDKCTSKISWTVENPGPEGVVIIIRSTGQGFAGGALQGSADAWFITTTPTILDLYTGATLLNSVTVTGNLVNSAPAGIFDGVFGTQLIGWTCDLDVPTTAPFVHLYIDEQFVLADKADKTGEDPISPYCGGYKDRRYIINIPDKFKDGKNHSAKVYGIDNITTGTNTLLNGSPKTFNIQLSGSPSHSPSALPSASASSTMKIGDINSDGKVDIFDFNRLLSDFGKTGENLPSDLDRNKKVDIFDFNILLKNFGK